METTFLESHEIERLASLDASEILDTGPDPHFDAIVRVAREALNVSTAAISFIDRDRQWVKSALGLFSAGDVTSRDVAFCNQAIRFPADTLVIEDASLDPRFSDNPLVVRPGGIRFYAGVPLLDDDGHALGALCVIDDAPRQVSDQELEILRDLAIAVGAAMALHRSLVEATGQEERRKAAIDLNPRIPWTSNPEGHILEISPSLVITLATGKVAPLEPPDWTNLIHPDDLRDVQARREQAIAKGKPYDIEHRMRAADGSWRWFRSFAAPRRDEDGEIAVWFGSSEDITERRISQQRAIYLAYHDGLTGMPNRVRFSDLLEARIAAAGRDGTAFALLCLDLDHFKGVNDRLGNPGGDAVLKQIAERLAGCMGPTDVLARFGGDEFFVLQTGLPDDVLALAERVSVALSEPILADGHSFSVTASIGVAQFPSDGTEPDTLFRNADLALHRAKANGRANCCLFDTTLDEQQSRLLALRLDLKGAIDRDEFELAYQPLVSLRTGRIEGFEALLRWRHPSLGWVSPAEFIPCAEESGQIIPIGRWAIERACRDAVTFPGDISVSVNLSPIQFRDLGLLEAILESLEGSGLAASRLELEVTESVLMLDNDANLRLLRALRDRGITITLDDFGTGFSSLNYLQRFPFDKLKIDRSVITRVTEGEGGRAVLRAVVAMCRALGINVTAEGVETDAQFEQVRNENCDQLQGYLISKPVPLAGVLPLVHRLNPLEPSGVA